MSCLQWRPSPLIVEARLSDDQTSVWVSPENLRVYGVPESPLFRSLGAQG